MKKILFASCLAACCVRHVFGVYAGWIQPAGEAGTNANVATFRKSIRLESPVKRATWRVSALGAFVAKVNGKVVSRFLDPGFTQPEKTRYEVPYDVSRHLVCGENVFEVTVAPSWWRCEMTHRAFPKYLGLPYPENAALRAVLEIEDAKGKAREIVADSSWLSAYGGPCVDAGIFMGARVDARRKLGALSPSVPNFDFTGEVLPRLGPPIVLREDLALAPKSAYVWSGVENAKGDSEFGRARVVRRYAPGEVFEVAPGETLVVDFGQNSSAVPRLEFEGEEGAELHLRFSEALNDSNGERSRRCDGPAGSAMFSNLRTATADVRHVMAAGKQKYVPQFTFFGYRYASVTATSRARIHSFVSVPVTSIAAKDESPDLVTDNPKLNRLVQNVRWGFRSNYLEVPTDCPQRNERLGWTADTLAFVSAAEYLADVEPFLRKWLKDLRDGQNAEGAYPILAPLVWAYRGNGAVSGWSDAGILVPYRLWKRYGHRETLEENWAAMTHYLDYLEAHDGPDRQDYGDWQAFEHSFTKPGNPCLLSSDEYREIFRHFFYVWDAMAMKEMAHDLGKGAEEARFAAIEERARRLFREKYIGTDGLMEARWRGQTTDLFMLKLKLVEGAAAAATKAHLLADFKVHGDCLQTGFLGTSILMETLSEIGATDVAYTLLLQEKCPSWLFSVVNGATTIWERWDCYDPVKGFQDPGMNSFNHYAYGAVYSWMMGYMAGIREDPASPGMRRFILAPEPDSRVGHVKAAYDSPVGIIESEWTCKDGRVDWRFRIPEGSRAIVRFAGQKKEYGAGEWRLESAANR